MPTSVTFNSPITCAVTPPGGVATATTQCGGTISATANVTASISADTSGGALTVLSVTSYVMKTVVTYPGAGELPPGAKPVPVKTEVPEQVAQSNGVTPLNVVSGQFVEVAVQFAPNPTTPANCTATLLINGDTWDPVSIPVTATMGKITAKIKPVFVDQGKTVDVNVTVTLAAGAPTTVDLIMSADGSAVAPNVTVKPLNSSVKLDIVGKAVPVTFKVSADALLAAGDYTWNLGVWSYGKTSSFSVGFNITVGVPYCFITSKLDGTMIDISGASTESGAGLDAYPKKLSGTDNQLWNFAPDPAGSGCYYIVSKLNGYVIDIKGDSSKDGALLDAYPMKSGADNQLWYFVQDPGGSGYCFIVSKLNGNVIDIQNASTISGAALDAYPVKLTQYQNQLWKVEGGNFPSVLPTVPAPFFNGNGNANYFVDADGEALTGVSVTVTFKSDFVSSSNGYSFQLNGDSTKRATIGAAWQQFVIFASPGDTQLVASIQTWSGTAATDWINNIQVPLANLPSPTIPKSYSFNITLTYYSGYPPDGYSDPSALVSGAIFTVYDDRGNNLGSQTLTIIGSATQAGGPATVANLAPLAALAFNIGGDYNKARATLTEGAGTITYAAAVGLSVSGPEPSYTPLNIGTAEQANVIFSPLPWPWSDSMDDGVATTSLTQSFEVASGTFPTAPTPLEHRRGLLPPADPTFGRKMKATARGE